MTHEPVMIRLLLLCFLFVCVPGFVYCAFMYVIAVAIALFCQFVPIPFPASRYILLCGVIAYFTLQAGNTIICKQKQTLTFCIYSDMLCRMYCCYWLILLLLLLHLLFVMFDFLTLLFFTFV